MKPVKMQRGWGKEYLYICGTCGHDKWIYEGHPNTGESYETSGKGFWLLLIIIELFVFIDDYYVTAMEYIAYAVVFLFLLYKAFQTKQLYKKGTKKSSYEIIDEVDGLTSEEEEEKERINYAEEKGMKFMVYPIVFVGSIIASLVFENPYFLILSVASVAYAYYFGFLNISLKNKKGKK